MTADERAETIVSDQRSRWYRWIDHLGATPVSQYHLMDEELQALIAAAIRDAERAMKERCKQAAETKALELAHIDEDCKRLRVAQAVAVAIGALPDEP